MHENGFAARLLHQAADAKAARGHDVTHLREQGVDGLALAIDDGRQRGGRARALHLCAGLPDHENQRPLDAILAFQQIAGLAHQIGQIDRAERIGAGDLDQLARREAGENFSRFQHGQRTFQSAQVESLHGAGLTIASARTRSSGVFTLKKGSSGVSGQSAAAMS